MKNHYYNPSSKDITPSWFIIDAKGQRLGKVATRVAMILMGKHDPSYVPHLDNGHRVVVINAAHLSIDERKLEQKTYYRHTGFPGGLRSQNLAELHESKPTEVIRKAVKGMLPKNRMGAASLRKLYIYADETHDQQAQQPKPIEV
jgi:large subunit ribosomal protein L13